MGVSEGSGLLSRRTALAVAATGVYAWFSDLLTPERPESLRRLQDLDKKMREFEKIDRADCSIRAIFTPESPQSVLLLFAFEWSKDAGSPAEKVAQGTAANQLNKTAARTAKLFGVDTITGPHLTDFIATVFNQCVTETTSGAASNPPEVPDNKRLRESALREIVRADPTCAAAWHSTKNGYPLRVAAVDSPTLLAAKQDPSVINSQRHTTLLQRASSVGTATIALWPWQLFGALKDTASAVNSSCLIIAVTPHALNGPRQKPFPALPPTHASDATPELA